MVGSERGMLQIGLGEVGGVGGGSSSRNSGSTCVMEKTQDSILSKKMRKMMVVGVSIYRDDGGDGDKLGEIEQCWRREVFLEWCWGEC